MARQDKVASRYAKAVADFLKEEAKIRAVMKELDDFGKIVEANPELSRAFSSEVFLDSQRRGVVEDLAARLSLSDDTRRILIVLVRARRLSALAAIVRRLNLILLEAAGSISLEVYAANSLSAEEREKIERRFENILGKKTQASYLIDPSLIGGLRVVAGGKTYDGSLAGWLSGFEEELVGGRL